LGIVIDKSGTLFVADSGNNVVRSISDGVIKTIAGNGIGGSFGDGGPATSASLNFPSAVALDSIGNLYIAESSRIRKVANGFINTVAPHSRAMVRLVSLETGERLSTPRSAAPRRLRLML
jgi:hypothetical protein